jgi:DNA-binding MarR family transcriptional regulator
MIYRIDLIASPQILDAKGRCVHLPVMRPLTDSELLYRAAVEVDTRMKLLRAIADEPKGTQRRWAERIGRRASIVNRQLKKLQRDGLADNTGGRWALTAKGRRAIEEADSEPEVRR